MESLTTSILVQALEPFRSKRNPENRVSVQKTRAKGFALIATLSLLVLLVIIALGLLSLSATALRTSSHEAEMRKARANARLALMMAISDLQKAAGPDTRITATSQALAGVNGSGYVTGAWRSWEGNDHDKTTGKPIAPNYGSKRKPYDTKSPADGRFLGWLVSGPGKDNDAENPPSVTENTATGTVPLLGKGSLGPLSGKEVHLVPTNIGDDGAMAWWIQGENQKALMKKAAGEPANAAAWSERLAAYGRPDTKGFGFTDDTELDKAISRQSLNLATNSSYSSTSNPTAAGAHFHDITAHSRGLLTNTANGGWRRDLSLMSENYDKITAKNFFSLTPETEFAYNNGEFIYNWSSENQYVTENGEVGGGASTAWPALVKHVLKYKDATVNPASGAASLSSITTAVNTGKNGVDIRPVLARLQWIYYLTAGTNNNGVSYTAQLKTMMVATYWNPYNVTIPSWTGDFWLRDNPASPNTFQIKVGNQVTANKDINGIAYNTQGANVGGNITYTFSDSKPWSPGETRIYTSGEINKNDRTSMSKGFRPLTGGYTFNLRTSNGTLINNRPPQDIISVTLSLPAKSELTLNQWDGSTGATSNMAGNNIRYNIAKAKSQNLWQKTIEKVNGKFGVGAGYTLQDVAVEPVPFLTTITQFKTIPPQDSDLIQNTNIMVGRGYSNNNPIFRKLSSTRYSSSGVRTDNGDYPESLPVDFLMIPMNGSTNDVSLPEGGLDAANPFGYIGTGFSSSIGLSRMAIAEVPVRRLRSLGELQHFPIAYYNPTPPYISNPIGNSNANYLIGPNQIAIDGDTSSYQASYDHSYVANHLLFDDWFVSSLTSGADYNNFLAGNGDLSNEMYVPANIAASSDYKLATAWYDVASKMEVEGMFNVNSTSVEAWKALLKNLKGAKVPQNTTDSSGALDEDDETTPAPRMTVAGSDDPEQSSPEIASLTSYTRLTDDQIEALAEQIVKQVKLRGPFLSLSEFVNRQLAETKSLALAGTIESALAELSKMSADKNPYAPIQNIFTVTPVASSLSGFNHVFPEAADGNPIYGYPAWIRQADVLRSIAPVLSVRDDTFCIRAYGKSGNVQAWCEALVQRKADYVDPADSAAPLPSTNHAPISPANLQFGRKFEIISFRWLSPDEV